MTKPLPLKRGVRKIIFLDIDGVLNSTRSCVAMGGYPWNFRPSDKKKFDRIAINLIKLACKRTGAKVVISSTWRHKIDAETFKRGLRLPVVGTTPSRLDDVHRGVEIQEWLDNNPDATQYAIVDDDAGLNFLDEQKPFLVKTDGKEGFLLRDYEKILAILGPAKETA